MILILQSFFKDNGSKRHNKDKKEALALVLAMKHFWVYVASGDKIVVYSDHNPLAFLQVPMCQCWSVQKDPGVVAV